ncbi:hypothetical protein ACTQX1_08215 [Collinsella bouchesdurhonensis]|uniref:hypothetical protein n=2 Tax=Bacteria TaxID=2 RepID=UPI003F88AEA3
MKLPKLPYITTLATMTSDKRDEDELVRWHAEHIADGMAVGTIDMLGDVYARLLLESLISTGVYWSWWELVTMEDENTVRFELVDRTVVVTFERLFERLNEISLPGEGRFVDEFNQRLTDRDYEGLYGMCSDSAQADDVLQMLLFGREVFA